MIKVMFNFQYHKDIFRYEFKNNVAIDMNFLSTFCTFVEKDAALNEFLYLLLKSLLYNAAW